MRVDAEKYWKENTGEKCIANVRTTTKRQQFSYHSRVMIVDRDEYLDTAGKPIPVYDLPALPRSIVDIDTSFSKQGTIRFSPKVPERHKSAVELARIFGMHKDKVELSGKLESDEIGCDIERSARVIAILEAARRRQAGLTDYEMKI